jgi:hypothetical protein
MDKIYLKDNYIVTELSGVTAVFGKNYTVYSENTTTFFLNSSFPINNARSVTIDFSRSSTIFNEAGTVAYTTATLRSFFLANTGFKSPSGGSGGVWGGITGTLSSQTDLQSALDAKQNTLTLTTTGTSGAATLVGSTLNIPQYSGGGASGIHGFLTPSGMGVTAMVITAATNTATPFANTMYTYPIIMANDYTFNSMQIYCQASLAGGLARILIYSDLNSAPNSKIYESTNIDLSTTGTKTITNTMTFTKGTIYWMVLHFGSGGAPLLIRSMNALSTMPIGYRSNNAPYNLISKSSIPLGSAPTTFGASSVSTINAPLIALFQ